MLIVVNSDISGFWRRWKERKLKHLRSDVIYLHVLFLLGPRQNNTKSKKRSESHCPTRQRSMRSLRRVSDGVKLWLPNETRKIIGSWILPRNLEVDETL
jgi:hypothetical protein